MNLTPEQLAELLKDHGEIQKSLCEQLEEAKEKNADLFEQLTVSEQALNSTLDELTTTRKQLEEAQESEASLLSLSEGQQQDIEALQAKLAAAEKDASRYQYARENGLLNHASWNECNGCDVTEYNDYEIDAAIDAQEAKSHE